MTVKQGIYTHAGERVPNLAPMVDVIMVLLVFFMLGATLKLSNEGMLATELDPRSGPAQGKAVELIPIVKIALEDAGGAGCNIYVNGQKLDDNSFTALHALLSRRVSEGADAENPVVVAAQSGVRWRYVIAAMDASVRAGFRNVQFAVHLGQTDR